MVREEEERTCRVCGSRFVTDVPRKQVCDACRKESAKRAREAYTQRQKESAADIEQTCRKCGRAFFEAKKHMLCPECRGAGGHCQRCGKALAYMHASQKYCPACKELAHKESQRRTEEKKRAKRHAMNTAIETLKSSKKIRDRVTLCEYDTGLAEGCAYRREDGVIVLPPVEGKSRRDILPPKPRKAKKGSLEDVLYKLAVENHRRRAEHLPELSYGRFVADHYIKEELADRQETERLKKSRKTAE